MESTETSRESLSTNKTINLIFLGLLIIFTFVMTGVIVKGCVSPQAVVSERSNSNYPNPILKAL